MENSTSSKNFEPDELSQMIQMIQRQTNYTEEMAREKLTEFNYKPIDVIKNYMGLDEKKEKPIKSINQEMYRQMRKQLDISEFRQKQHEKLLVELNEGNN
jgi:hypothetical protein